MAERQHPRKIGHSPRERRGKRSKRGFSKPSGYPAWELKEQERLAKERELWLSTRAAHFAK